MALNTRISVEAQEDQLGVLATLLDNGYFRIYNGAQPATPNTAIGAQVLLVELRFGTPAFAAAVAGLITGNPITPALGIVTGTPSWCRLLKSNGTSAIVDGTVGIVGSKSNVELVHADPGNPVIQEGAQVTVASVTIALPAQGA